MSHPPEKDVTALRGEWSGGDRDALARLIQLVYGELRRLAAAYLRVERPDHTLQPTALVHEAYQRLSKQRGVEWKNRSHFFAVAARMMRRILVDHARKRHAAKRDAAAWLVETVPGASVTTGRPAELLSLDRALEGLERVDADQARIVELRFFAGLTIEETAEAAAVSPATVKREWQTARAWLRREMGLTP
ncbi:MAG: sigma-70 family RNA polymerase sigma factor [Syntrophomonadaceae bacterium]